MERLTAQAIFENAFHPGRAPRSAEYKRGVLACLRVRVDGMAYEACPYPEGSAQADAYFAGVEEGRQLAPVGRAPEGFGDPAHPAD